MEKTKNMILDAHYAGKTPEEIREVLKNEFYRGEIIPLQPEKAFDLNSYYMVNMIIKECAEQ